MTTTALVGRRVDILAWLEDNGPIDGTVWTIPPFAPRAALRVGPPRDRLRFDRVIVVTPSSRISDSEGYREWIESEVRPALRRRRGFRPHPEEA